MVKWRKNVKEPLPQSLEDYRNLDSSKVFRNNSAQMNSICSNNDNETTSKCKIYLELKTRKDAIDQKCLDLKSNQPRFHDRVPGFQKETYVSSINSKNLIVLKYRKILWCPVFKAASSSWMHQIPLLTNFKPTQIRFLQRRFVQINNLIKAIAPPLPQVKLKTFVQSENPVKFLITRHPLDRLLSAYRDKFESHNEYFDKLFGKAIVKKYREKGRQIFGYEFYDRGGIFNGCPLADKACAEKRGAGNTPTFWEFTQAIIHDGISDGHWIPINLHCR